MRKPLTLVVLSFLAMLLATWSQGEFAGSLIGGSEGMPVVATFVFNLLGAASGVGLVVGVFWVVWVWLTRAISTEAGNEAPNPPV